MDYNDRCEEIRDQVEPLMEEMVSLLKENNDIIRLSRANTSLNFFRGVFFYVAGEGTDKPPYQEESSG